MAHLELKSIQKSYGSTEVIKRLDLSIEDGEFVVFVGPSGCGKSTLLRMIAGLEDITNGDLLIGNRLCNNAAPHERGIAMVFQSYALYPHMTVEENIGFHLHLTGRRKAEVRERVQESARILQIEHLLDRLPSQLSGGQRQRVAIGRAIVRKPDVFLFDEPLSNLDAALRLDTRMEIAKLHRDLGTTMIYVTHDQVEAMTLADRIVVLDKGIVQQVGAPLELYHQPANLFVAGFIGSPRMNLMEVSVMEATYDVVRVHSADLQPLDLPYAGQDLRPGDALILGIRPHDLAHDKKGALSGELTLTERLGNETILNVRVPNGRSIIAALPGDFAGEIGQLISLSFLLGKVHVFLPTGRRLKPSGHDAGTAVC